MRIACLCLLLMMMISFFTNAKDNTPTLTIGAQPFNSPFTTEINDKAQFMGFDITLMNEICRRLQVRCVYKPSSLANLFTLVDKQAIDLAIGGIIVTEDRQEAFLFSMPYLMSYGSFVVLENTPLKQVDDLVDKKIAVQDGSVYELYIKERFGDQVDVITFPFMPDLLSVLVDTQANAILLDKPPAVFWTNKESNIKLLGKPIQIGNGYAIMTNRNNQLLIKRINKAFLSMLQDGTYEKIYNEFF